MPGHCALLAGQRADGGAVFEVVPAHLRLDGLWQLLGTPALAEGCAEGDVLRVGEQGDFEVEERGGKVAVLSYARAGQSLGPHVASLRRVLDRRDGTGGSRLRGHRDGDGHLDGGVWLRLVLRQRVRRERPAAQLVVGAVP